MSVWTNLGEALKQQKLFSDLFFDAGKLDEYNKQEMLKTFVLALHADATGIVEGVNYKDHRRKKHPVDTQKILYKSVDVYRYVLAILNLWGFGEDEFAAALSQKDDYLHYRHVISTKKWNGEPVVLFDMDDVLAEFRTAFCDFVSKDSGIFIDPDSHEYYNISTFKEHGLSNEHYFRTFMEKHGFLRLEKNAKYVKMLQILKEMGFWIQIVTARPEDNLTAFYDTYSWLRRNEIPADGVAFTPEKFNWFSQQKIYGSQKFFAVDDSAKHAAEYVKHGVRVLVPEKPYNTELRGLKGITYVPAGENPLEHAIELIV